MEWRISQGKRQIVRTECHVNASCVEGKANPNRRNRMEFGGPVEKNEFKKRYDGV